MATNTPEVLNETVADTVMGLSLATDRRMPELDSWVKSGQWNSDARRKMVWDRLFIIKY